MNILRVRIVTGAMLLALGWMELPAADVCLFDEDAAFADKLFRSAGSGVATVTESGPAFKGKLSLNVTPVMRGCEFFFDRTFVWEYAIAEKPVPGEFRYILFAWKKTGGRTIQLGLTDDRSGAVVAYYAGDKPKRGIRAGMKHIQVSESLPAGWQYVIRDMYADLEGSQPNFLINGIYFIPEDGVSADYDAIYLSDSREALERMAAALK